MWPHERFPHCRVVQVWRLLVHWQAYLPKRARKQAAVRLCGALLVSFWFDDTKTRRAVDRCHRQTPKKTLRLRKSEPVTEGTIFSTTKATPHCPGWVGVELIPAVSASR